jgi:hypothetical protein
MEAINYSIVTKGTSVDYGFPTYFSSEGSLRNTSGAIHCGWV